ncbi:hypothetical protein D3C78_997930 [compost metagenome]
MLAAGHLLAIDRGAAEAVAIAGQPGHAAPVIDAVLVAPVIGVAVGFQAQPGEVAGAGLVQGVDGFARVFQVAVVVGVVGAQADPVAGGPLRGDVAVEVQAVLVFRGQLGKVGAVLAEALGHAQVGAQQGGVEGPVQRFDVGVAPHAIVVAQALAAEAQLLAGVSGQAAVADPEFAHGQVAFVRFAAIGTTAVGLGFVAGLAQGVGLDDVGGRHRLAHGEGAPVAALAVHPGAQVQAQAVDVTAGAGAQVTVVFGLAGDFHVQAEVLFSSHRRQGRARPEQGEAQTYACFHPRIECHRESSPCSGCATACRGRAPGPGPMAPRAWRSCCNRRSAWAFCAGGSCWSSWAASWRDCSLGLACASWLNTQALTRSWRMPWPSLNSWARA